MEMHQIRYFLAVARTLNFTRAADLCNVTQPSLTRAIQKLEEEFGGPLFNRERAMTHLTELGRMVLPHLEQTYEAAEAAASLAVSLGRAEVAPLVMGVARGLDTPALDDVLAALSEALPGLSLDLRVASSEDLLALSLKGGVDLLLITLPEAVPERLESWPLFSARYRIAMGPAHRLNGGAAVALAEAAREDWIDAADDGAALWRCVAAGSGMEPNVRHRVDSPGLALRLIARGLGLALMPEGAAPEGVVLADCADRALERPVVLAAIAGRRRGRAAEAFLRAARARDWPGNGARSGLGDGAAQRPGAAASSAASTSSGSARRVKSGLTKA